MPSRRRLLVPSALIAALGVVLLSAATAGATIKVGEEVSPANMELSGEADILKATAKFDTASGTMTYVITTREALNSNTEEEPPEVTFISELVTFNGPCTKQAVEAAEGGGSASYPRFVTLAVNHNLENPAVTAFSKYEIAEGEEGGLSPENGGPATRTISGNTMTVTASDARAGNGPFTCAVVGVLGGAKEPEILIFGLTALPEPAPILLAPAPPIAPAALSLGKLKTLKAKPGKWTKVNLKVTNTGALPVGPIAIKVKAPKGVIVKPATTKLPALLGGQTWPVPVEVKATEKAKPKSTISLTTSSGALTAIGSFLLKSTG
jgi:hypothetical protein